MGTEYCRAASSVPEKHRGNGLDTGSKRHYPILCPIPEAVYRHLGLRL